MCAGDSQLELWRSTASCFLKVPKHRAQGAGDGRRARRLAESEPEPLGTSDHPAHNCELAGRGEQQAASRVEQP